MAFDPNLASPDQYAQSPKFDRQVIPLATNFAGLNRITSPQNLDASQSPDTTDARSSNLRMGALGPRNGRYALINRTTDTLADNTSGRSYLPFTGMGVLNSSYGKYRVLTDAGGSWVSSVIGWPGLNAVSTPSALTGMSNVRTRFLQYKNRLYGFNARERMRNLDGIDWQFAGITRPPIDFKPAGFVNDGSGDVTKFAIATLTVVTASITAGVATLTTGVAHGYSVGDSVTVQLGDPAYNGTFTLTAVTSTTMSYSVGGAVSTPDQLAVTSITRGVSPNSVQRGVVTAPKHPLTNGDIVAGDLVTVAVSTPTDGTFGAGSNQTVGATMPVNAVTGDDVTVYYEYDLRGDVSPTAVSGTITRVGKPQSLTPFWTLQWSVTSNVFAGVTSAPHGLVVGQIIGARGQYQSANSAIPGDIAGSFAIVSVPTDTEFTFAYTHPDTGAKINADDQLNFWKYPLGSVYKVLAGGGGGSGSNAGSYRYYVTASNSKHGDAWGRPIESIPSLISDEVTLLNQAFTINNIPSTHVDPQVDTWNIYRNKTGEYSTDLTSDQQDFWLVGTVAMGTTTFTDTAPDYKLTGADRLRFDQNIPPAFKFAAMYGERMFGCGFDPITSGTASPATTPLTGYVVNGGFGAGVTSINVNNVTTPITVGETFTITGISQVFTATSALLGAGSLSFTPALPSPVTDLTAMTFYQPVGADKVQLTTALPDGVLGCWFKVDGDNQQYVIIDRPTTTTITLDRNYVGTLTAGKFAIYRNPWEIWFSEFQDVEAWGPDGEQRRFKLEVPGHQAVTGLCEWNNNLLVFTSNSIYAIDGKGPNRTDIRLLPAPIYSGLGALSGDAICKVDNDVYFLSSRGPCAMANGTPQLVGINLNYDYIDALTYAETSLAVMGTDGRDVYVSVPSATDQTMNSKTFRFEVYTKSWWEETGMCPTLFVRENSDGGNLDQLFYLQGEFAVIIITDYLFDGNSGTSWGADNPVIHNGTGEQYVNLSAYSEFNILETCLRFYSKNVLVAIRRIVPRTPGGSNQTSDTKMVWSTDPNLPYSGTVPACDRVEWGAIPWRWVSKTLEVNGKVTLAERCFATFDAKGATTCFKTNIIDGVKAANADKITSALKAESWPISASHFDYAVEIGSRDGAVIRHVEVALEAEASNK